MPHSFLDRLRAAWPPPQWQEVTVIACVSGGADSVALLQGLAQLRQPGPGRLIAAHFNHRLRGADADGDEAFTRELARQLAVPLEVGAATRQPDPGAATSEADARSARYAFFGEVARRQGARFVVTAHTADDQVETILQRIVRGTGIAGLAGIPRCRPLARGISILRPLLGCSRQEILDFLAAMDQPYCEDASNAEARFTRNRIRARLLPELAREYNPQVREALLRLGQLAADSQDTVQVLAAEVLQQYVANQGPDSVQLRCQPLAALPLAAVREILLELWRQREWPQQAMDFAHWNQLAELFQPAAPRQHCLPGNIRATREGGYLHLTRTIG